MNATQSFAMAESPQAFLRALEDYARASRAVEHPLFAALDRMPQKSARDALRTVLGQYYQYSAHFTRYLGAALAGLECLEHRASILSNLAEEGGAIAPKHAATLERMGLRPSDVAQPHPLLFQRFLRAIGSSSHGVCGPDTHAATRVWIQTMLDLCRGPAAQAVGALGIASEGVVQPLYERILTAVGRAWPELSAYQRAFFELHVIADDGHAEELRRIGLDLLKNRETAPQEMACGVIKAIEVRASFFDAMYAAVVPQTLTPCKEAL
jgi:pyrroloquinoline-quinone synthase